MPDPHAAALKKLRDFAMRFPLATEDHPWGETAIKVKGKVFIFLSRHDGKFNLSVKLPVSGATALGLSFAEPTGYGLGKHGWVTVYVDGVPTEERDVLFDFVEESYRAVAPKTLVKRLDAKPV